MEFTSNGGESEQSKKMKEEFLDLLVRIADPAGEKSDPSEYKRMLKLYSDGLSLAPRSERIGLSAAEFHQNVISALRLCAKGWPSATRQKIRADLAAERERDHRATISNQAIDQAIDFGLRTWLMFNCSRLGTTGKPWRWPEGMSIRAFAEEFVSGCFSPESSSRDQTAKKFPRKFTARNIQNIAGIKIQWTDFLSDHLAFSEEGGRNGTLSIFRQKRWLLEMEKLSSSNAPNNQLGSGQTGVSHQHNGIPGIDTTPNMGSATNNGDPSHRQAAKNIDIATTPASPLGSSSGKAKQDGTSKHDGSQKQVANQTHANNPNPDHTSKQDATPKPISMPACVLPHELIQETLRSLDLLCPASDPDSVQWLGSADVDFASEFYVFRHPLNTPRLRDFTYLRERLLDLIEEYEAPPRHWRNVYKDRRNPTTFWTFWIGVVILVLTLIAVFLAGVTYEKTP